MRKLFCFMVLAIAMIPLAVCASPGETLTKAITNIASMQEENGAWSRLKGEFPPEVEPTAWAVKVLAMNKVAPDRVEKGVDFILRDQKPDGGWNNNTAHTAFAMIALKQAGKGEEAIKKAVQYLRSVQDVDGGFKRIGKEGQSLTIYTGVVLYALKEAGFPKNDPMVRQAMDWLVGCQNPDGGYGLPKGSPSFSASTAWVVKALLAYGTAPATPFVADGVGWLLSAQKPSGGFSAVPPAPEDPEFTAYAMMALSNMKDRSDVVQKGADYLARAQQPDGAYISAAPQQFNKVAKKNTQSTCFAAWALSEIR